VEIYEATDGILQALDGSFGVSPPEPLEHCEGVLEQHESLNHLPVDLGSADSFRSGEDLGQPALTSQPLDLCLERSDTRVACIERGCDVGGLEALGYMLRAVHVPGADFEQDYLFGLGLVTLRH
jgi:hypothetical protein